MGSGENTASDVLCPLLEGEDARVYDNIFKEGDDTFEEMLIYSWSAEKHKGIFLGVFLH